MRRRSFIGIRWRRRRLPGLGRRSCLVGVGMREEGVGSGLTRLGRDGDRFRSRRGPEEGEEETTITVVEEEEGMRTKRKIGGQ